MKTDIDNWDAPQWLRQLLGKFDIEPCNIENGLDKPWEGRVWLNPPSGLGAVPWLTKMADKKMKGLAFLFARTDSKWFHDEVFSKAVGVLFWQGRFPLMKNGQETDKIGSIGCCLVAYNIEEIALLATLDGQGKGRLVIPMTR